MLKDTFERVEFAIRETLDDICEFFHKRKLGRFVWYENRYGETIVFRIVQVSYGRFTVGGILYTVLTSEGNITYITDNDVIRIRKDNEDLDEYDDYIEELVKALYAKNKEIE